MQDGDIGLYRDSEGVARVTLRKGVAGVPLADLLPPSQKDNRDFPIAAYFDRARLWLATPEQLQDWRKTLATGGSVSSVQVDLPRIDLVAYKLEKADGDLDADALVPLFVSLGQLWLHQPQIAPHLGLFHALFQSGMPTDQIGQAIISMVERDALPKNGTGSVGTLTASRGQKIMHAVVAVQNRLQGRVPGAIVPPPEMEKMMMRWFGATRSLPMGAMGYDNPVLLWADFRRLGLIDASGREDLKTVEQLATYVLATEDAPGFAEVVAWQDRQVSYHAKNGPPHKAAREHLRTKRKQGRLNRKRGRQ
ncbi:hypothetical protein [Pseudooceanicola atlanticus]|uniref:hypothetical protein n=1 Tax=Pseudooceanicola atlanticus TaxID=1461694 RepID=UPI0023554507|nr:hypothetical protein [Pseudooceanicola atlanticus]